jgi:hypothetical protein
MKYKIGSEVKELTSAKGNQFKKLNVRDESGVVTEGVASFSGDSLYASLVSGAEVEGILVESDYNGKKSYTLKGELKRPSFMGGAAASAQKTQSITKAMDRKEESIQSFQHNKEEGIILSASARDATLMVTAFAKDSFDDEEIKEKWLMWRKWLLRNYKQVEGLNSHGEHVPFSKASVDEDIDVNSIPFS